MIYIVITPFFPSPESWRGAFVLDQIKAIQRNSSYKVVVFRPQRSRFLSKSYQINGITVHRFSILTTPSYLFNGLFNTINGALFIRAFKRVFGEKTAETLKQIKVIHCHTCPYTTFGITLKKLAPQAKILVQHHDLDPLSIRNGYLAQWKPNTVFRARNSLKLLNAADLNICISSPCKDNLLSFPKARPEESFQGYLDILRPLQKLPSVRNKKVYTLYNGVDLTLFFPKTKMRSNIYRIGCVSNFQIIKDHITLIKAFELLIEKGYNNIRLSLIGTGETRAMCEEYVNTHQLNQFVEWQTEMKHDDLPDYYRTLDIFVLPSYFEGFGCVYTEAFACGVPFIGVYNQGVAECLKEDERDKWLINPHDYNMLASLIENHYLTRPTQHLCQPIDINILVSRFIEHLETI